MLFRSVIALPFFPTFLLTTCEAQKYKDYQFLQDRLSGKAQAPKSETQLHSKRKAEFAEPSLPRPTKRVPAPTRETPQKRRAIEIITPSHPRIIQPGQLDPDESPSAIQNLFTPRKPTAIGPTPQKDGKLLGLFDLLPDESPEKDENPPRVNATPSQGGAHLNVGDILATPSGAKHSRTPRSNSKRFLLDAFMTPVKRRLSNAEKSAKNSLTPSSISKLNFATPEFLRRDNRSLGPKLEAVKEVDEDAIVSPEAPTPRGPRRPLVRGLSSMLADLRSIQDKALSEDEEAMREMEGGVASGPRPKSATKSMLPTQPKLSPVLQPDLLPDVQVLDSQRDANPFMEFPDIDLSKDVSEEYENDEDEMSDMEKLMVERDNKLPVYKKKGQKRTTRRHNMKPVATKKTTRAKKTADAAHDDDIPGDDEVHNILGETRDGVGNPDIIPDTQHANTFTADSLPLFDSKRNFDSESEDGTEYTASIGGTRYKRAKRPSDYRSDKEARKHKVGAQVHTNYQRLKIRGNTGMKSKTSGGRFAKRR